MRWKQFFTPVKSIRAPEAEEYMRLESQGDFTLLDVRQPGEYAAGHIPGAKLIPIAELDKRLDEIDPKKPTLVYCAIGGRSRVAAQMLAGKGFENVINMAGGFKAWDSHIAMGPEDQGLMLFSGNEFYEETLVVAYSLEKGLREFYLSMMEKIKTDKVKSLFQKLSDIEIKHQDRIFDEYLQATGKTIDRKDFEENLVVQAVEGGLTTSEYINRFKPDWNSPAEIIALAMSIEAQALDLYTRASERNEDQRAKAALKQIAEEERTHLEALGQLMDA